MEEIIFLYMKKNKVAWVSGLNRRIGSAAVAKAARSFEYYRYRKHMPLWGNRLDPAVSKTAAHSAYRFDFCQGHNKKESELIGV